jgi:hypothetical protein
MVDIELSMNARSKSFDRVPLDSNLDDDDDDVLVVQVKDTDLGTGLKTCWRHSRAPLAVLLVCFVVLVAMLAVFRGAPGRQEDASSEVGLLLVGDWGRFGSNNQKTCAAGMAATAAALRADILGPNSPSSRCDSPTGSYIGVISVGDNFYDDGVTASDAMSNFEGSFASIYDYPALESLPWTAVMGNHDYHGDVDVQIGDGMRKMAGDTECGPRWDAVRSGYREFGKNALGIVGVCLIDTNPWIKSYREKPEKYSLGGLIGTGTWEQWENDEIASLERCLVESRASWKIVVGHHGIVTYSPHGGSQPELLRVRLTLEKFGAAAYFNGHDHNLQHIVPEPVANVPGSEAAAVRYVTTGAGSNLRDDVDLTDAYPNGDGSLQFQAGNIPGFVALRAARSKLVIEHRGGVDGEILYTDEIFAPRAR